MVKNPLYAIIIGISLQIERAPLFMVIWLFNRSAPYSSAWPLVLTPESYGDRCYTCALRWFNRMAHMPFSIVVTWITINRGLGPNPIPFNSHLTPFNTLNISAQIYNTKSHAWCNGIRPIPKALHPVGGHEFKTRGYHNF
jgi:hypothetical protein